MRYWFQQFVGLPLYGQLFKGGLKVKFVDIDLDTLNISLYDLEKKISKKTKALMLVHALGNCTDMTRLTNICKKNDIILIEDTM